MTIDMRVLIFGLPKDALHHELQPLLGPFKGADVVLMALPDDSDSAYAVVRVPADRDRAARVAQHISTLRCRGRRLQSWATAMAWA